MTGNDTLRALTFSLLAGLLHFATSTFATDAGDDFNDNSVDSSKWGPDHTVTNGVLTETNQRLEFTVNSGSSYDRSGRPWIFTQFPYTNDWEVQVDVVNNVVPNQNNQDAGFGFLIYNGKDANDLVAAEIYASNHSSVLYRGFYSELWNNGNNVQNSDTFNSGDLGVTNGAVRVAFNSTTKVLTVYYDIDPGNGYTWVAYGSYGVQGASGTTGNANWTMTDGDTFTLSVFGYDNNMAVASGQVYGDNFATIGGVTPPAAGTNYSALFSKVKEKCKTSGASTSCKLGAGLAATNTTDGTAPSAHLRVFLSTNNTYEAGVDTLLQEFDTGLVKTGKTKKLKVKQTLNSSSTGMFLLAVDEADTVKTSFQIP